MRGTIVRINLEGQFGFIRPEESNPNGDRRDVFFHVSRLQGIDFDERIREMRVEYEADEGLKGPRARVVWPAN